MSADELDSLPLAQRLALSYAAGCSRDAMLTLLLFDNRLAGVLRQRGENVLIAQMKLAWWRDRLSQPPGDWPRGEPLLARLRDWPGDVSRLVALVDGWEGLLAEKLDLAGLSAFAQGRGMAWRALADGLDDKRGSAPLEQAMREFALIDLAQHLSSPEERAATIDAARAEPWAAPRLPRKFRPALVLHALARRAMKRRSDDLLDGPGAMITALRLGLFGR